MAGQGRLMVGIALLLVLWLLLLFRSGSFHNLSDSSNPPSSKVLPEGPALESVDSGLPPVGGDKHTLGDLHNTCHHCPPAKLPHPASLLEPLRLQVLPEGLASGAAGSFPWTGRMLTQKESITTLVVTAVLPIFTPCNIPPTPIPGDSV